MRSSDHERRVDDEMMEKRIFVCCSGYCGILLWRIRLGVVRGLPFASASNRVTTLLTILSDISHEQRQLFLRDPLVAQKLAATQRRRMVNPCKN